MACREMTWADLPRDVKRLVVEYVRANARRKYFYCLSRCLRLWNGRIVRPEGWTGKDWYTKAAKAYTWHLRKELFLMYCKH
jgi:hypothetical protein